MLGVKLTARQCRIASSALILAPLAAGVLGGCAASTASSSGTPDAGTPPQDSSTPQDTGVGTMDTGTGMDSAAPALTLPFFVSDQFIPSGFMGDPTGIALSTGTNGPSCPMRAPGTPGGDCYVVTWAATNPTAMPWAGVYWQYPTNNWGTEPGLSVTAGAKQVSFYARGKVGGEIVTFKSGGLNDPVSATAGSYGDSFNVSGPAITLTTTWTQYTLSLQGATYPQGVLGAFVWVAAVTNGTNSNITFYIDDLKWE